MPESGALVLNEGGWGNNEAELSVIDFTNMRITNNFFSKTNGRGLGDVAQDVVVYGGNIYVSVWGSNTIEVIDRLSGRSTIRIALVNQGPRYMTCYDGKVYVSCYSPESVIRIDTASLQVEATCHVSGLRPEGICALGGKLYVVNSWQPDENGNVQYDSTMSVIDLASFSETAKITVGVNPQKVKAIDDTHLAISYTGDYGNAPGGIAIVDVETLNVQHKTANISNIDTRDGKIYYYAHNFGQAWDGMIHVLDGNTLQEYTITMSETSGFSQQYYPYAINIGSTNGDIYIAGAQYGANGDIYCLSPTGTLKWKLEAGPLPSKVVEF